MISFEQGLFYSIMLGILIGIIWGGRRILLLERLIYNLDLKMEHILERIEKDEEKIGKKLKVK